MGMTMAEKILAAHADRDRVAPGEYIWCRVDATSGHHLRGLERLGVDKVWDPDRVFLVDDHQAPPPTIDHCPTVKNSKTTALAPTNVPVLTVTLPHRFAPGAICTKSCTTQLWSTVADVLMIACAPILVSG